MANRTNNESLPSGNDTAPAELTAVVDELLNQLGTKFSVISNELVAKMDDMSRRLDNLEATIQAQATESRRADAEGAAAAK